MSESIEWIPTSERLPEVDKNGLSEFVLVTYIPAPYTPRTSLKNRKIAILRYIERDEQDINISIGPYWSSNVYTSDMSVGHSYIKSRNVTAWAVLPSPYREGEMNEDGRYSVCRKGKQVGDRLKSRDEAELKYKELQKIYPSCELSLYVYNEYGARFFIYSGYWK